MRSLALAVLLVPVAFAQTTSPGANAYAGSALCGTCHADLAQAFYKNPHYKSIASGKETPDKTGCEGCHGPWKNHIAAGRSAAAIRVFSQMTPSQVIDTCLTCHAKDFSKANIRRSAHTEADVVCTNCHSIHGSAQPKFLLAKKQTELCYGCHMDVRAQFNMPVKHRVNEGAVQCTDCHNPHGNFAPSWRTGTGAALVTASHDSEDPCLKCHVDKRGPFTFEHASVRVEGCMGCHVPHGTTNAKLLKRPVVFTICLECHNGAGTYGRENLGIFTQSASHNMLDPKFQQCTQCHVRIHGSDADARFLR